MKSPFPGVDPYIELCGLWEDFHSHLIEKIAERLARVLPSPYLVRSGERSYLQLVESEGKTTRPFKPDVQVVAPPTLTKPGATTTVAELDQDVSSETISMMPFITEEFRETFVEVYFKREDMRLVTCIEILSPSNKRQATEGWDQYLRKRQAMLMGQTNLIELDYLRQGDKFPMLEPWPIAPYTMLLCRRMNAPRCLVTKVYSLKPVPPLTIPLAFPDPDVQLELQPLLDEIYQIYHYDSSIDYGKPSSTITAEEKSWLQEQLKAREGDTQPQGGS